MSIVRVGPILRAALSALVILLLLAAIVPIPSWGQPFVHPYYVAVDASGNLYVTEPSQHRVQKSDANGVRIAQWGGFGYGIGQLNSPRGIAVDASGNVYVADRGNYRIQKFSSTGAPIARWSTPMGNQSRPLAIAVGGPNGNVYITDGNLKRVYVFDPNGTFVRSFGGVIGTGDGQFSTFQPPNGIAVDGSGNVYVADTGNNRIQKFDPTGGFLWKSGTGAGGSGNGQFILPSGLALDPAGDLYVVDTLNRRVQELGPNGAFKGKWGSKGSGPGEFSGPIGVATDSAGNVYVADTGNNRIQKFNPSGALMSIFGGADVRLSACHGEALNPIELRRSSSMGSLITVTSLNQYAGPVSLGVSCCLNAEDTGADMSHPPGIIVQMVGGNYPLTPNGSASVILDITATSSADSGKFIAVVRATNTAAGIYRALWVVFTVLPPEGAGIRLTASPGQTPGVSFFLPPITATTIQSTITIQSVSGFSGTVTLAAFCCLEIWRQLWIPIPGATVAISPRTVTLPPNGSATATVTVTIPTSSNSEFGKFLVMVEGAAALGIGGRTSIGITAVPASEPVPSCAPGAFLLRVGPLLTMGTTGPDLGAIAYYATPPTDAWKLEMQRGGGLPGRALIVLRNPKGSRKEITTVGCSTAGSTARVASGNSGNLTLTKGTDRTLLFRKEVCTARFLGIFWCTATAWRTVGVFAEPAFWSFVDTWRLTVEWHEE